MNKIVMLVLGCIIYSQDVNGSPCSCIESGGSWEHTDCPPMSKYDKDFGATRVPPVWFESISHGDFFALLSDLVNQAICTNIRLEDDLRIKTTTDVSLSEFLEIVVRDTRAVAYTENHVIWIHSE